MYLLRNLCKELRVILVLVILAMIPHVVRLVAKTYPINYLLVYNIYSPIELLLTYYFFKQILKEKIYSYIVDFSALIGFLVYLYFLSTRPFGQFYHESVGLNNLIYTGWILLVLLEIYEYSVPFDFSQPLFWVLVGLFMYSTGTTVVFSLWAVIRMPVYHSLRSLYLLNSIFNLIMYLFFAYAFYLCKRQKSSINYAK